MKRHTSAIEDLKAAYPNLCYDTGQLFNGDDLIESDADSLIEEHYNGFETVVQGHDNNSENEYPKIVDGKTYVEYEYFGDYQEAFDQI